MLNAPEEEPLLQLPPAHTPQARREDDHGHHKPKGPGRQFLVLWRGRYGRIKRCLFLPIRSSHYFTHPDRPCSCDLGNERPLLLSSVIQCSGWLHETDITKTLIASGRW